MSILETKNLTFFYENNKLNKKATLNNINISINKGEIIGIIGHTGSGKSTLVQHFNGLLKPSYGDIYISNENIWKNKSKIQIIRFKVGLVFQYPEHQLFENTVYKDIAFGPINMNLPPEQIKNHILNAIDIVGLPANLLNRSLFELSGGEKRKVAIAGVLAMNPEIIVFDEPTAGLDPKAKENLINKILSYHKKENNTVIFVSHNMDDVAKIADRIIVMDNGKISMFDTVNNVFSNYDYLKSLGLDIPQITKIMIMLKKRGYSVNQNIFNVEQGAKEILSLVNACQKEVVI